MYSLAVGSVTNALRGRDILNKHGINASIQRYSGEKRLGCGYVLIVSGNIDNIKNILKSSGIRIMDVNKK